MKNPHIKIAMAVSIVSTLGWWLLLPSLPPLVKGFAVIGGIGGLLVGVFYRHLVMRSIRADGRFYDFELEDMMHPLKRGHRTKERYRFMYWRCTFWLMVCFGGLGVGGLSLLDVLPIMAKNIGL